MIVVGQRSDAIQDLIKEILRMNLFHDLPVDSVSDAKEPDWTARILKPGARFACTTWELHELGGVKDYRPLLESAGFRVESYEPTPNWERYQRGVHERVLAERAALIQEMGEKGASFWIQGAQVEIPKLSHMRRILFVATRL